MEFGFGGPSGFSGFGGGGGRRQGPSVEHPLNLSLEDLYLGTKKRMKVTRSVLKADNRTTVKEEKILEIDIKPGWKAGTKVRFEREGDQAPNMTPGDIIFVIREKQHPVFQRDGNDLVYTHNIKLSEALTGTTVEVKTLDKRSLRIPVSDIVYPGYTKVIPREGMPISRTPGSFGNLCIKFNIVFPRVLSQEQKEAIAAILP